ncbi:DUF7575 domain-containing protein [Halomarina ordinaria]|uniref:Zinc ribbon domain-containing protein n=1 Tax=Halomarina ordinaria TaxID=3033939 RepID=A0ABD5U7K7_9EURY|nr:zinc ribbon domain-containing protein [Halomarina sp. PSRA2]
MSKRRPWLAVALAFVYPGLGHVYLREWLRALLWFLLTVATALVVVPPDLVGSRGGFDAILRAQQDLPLTAALAIVSVTAFSMLDAYWLAARNGEASGSGAGAGTGGRVTYDSADAATDRAGAGASASGASTSRDRDERGSRCPNCRREVDAEYDFCPWCATEFDVES